MLLEAGKFSPLYCFLLNFRNKSCTQFLREMKIFSCPLELKLYSHEVFLKNRDCYLNPNILKCHMSRICQVHFEDVEVILIFHLR